MKNDVVQRYLNCIYGEPSQEELISTYNELMKKKDDRRINEKRRLHFRIYASKLYKMIMNIS